MIKHPLLPLRLPTSITVHHKGGTAAHHLGRVTTAAIKRTEHGSFVVYIDKDKAHVYNVEHVVKITYPYSKDDQARDSWVPTQQKPEPKKPSPF